MLMDKMYCPERTKHQNHLALGWEVEYFMHFRPILTREKLINSNIIKVFTYSTDNDNAYMECQIPIV